jgi:putative transposase
MNLACFIDNLESVTVGKMRTKFGTTSVVLFWKSLFWNNAYAVVSAGSHVDLKQLLPTPTSGNTKMKIKIVQLTHD